MNQRLPGDVEISLEERKALTREISVYFDQEFEQDLSEFRAGMILDFFLKKLSFVVYNSAIDDAKAFLAESLEEMESTLFAKVPRSRK